ncbi:N-acetylmuramoyl-L-alanine amidase [Psychrobacter sp. FDAARGOS_221]|uniref:N-acetylmuramoyl-L-alanine amidase n=1 Tax=Psychrobacter sp. FDAARGOS_221 TaxID=1975705 RepID=UPI000BB53A5D|nr:N-acetylmuramoyl-L-alanine amidase [Psychrobacter sp. FDAARGOS_221]PNK60215.1 N-acetylmuramoyl-L-alanine amidase [Psychrobacter sp. FDAARGOS_221]
MTTPNRTFCAHTLATLRPLSLACGFVLALAGCTTTSPFIIDNKSYHSQGQEQRIKFIVLHYTVGNNERSLKQLTEGNVSVHYLIMDHQDDKIYQLVDDDKRAWHAGKGAFANRTMLNDTSIGIEIVNPGIKPEYRQVLRQTDAEYYAYEHYMDFEEVQIEKVAYLVDKLAKQYDIDPTHIIGHSDMAPSRKIDPGAKFPWEKLHKEYGIGAWYDEFDKSYIMNSGEYETASIQDIKQLFRDYGYDINDTDEWDKSSRNVIYAFQLHFRPQQPTGNMDSETYAILRALNAKYVDRD